MTGTPTPTNAANSSSIRYLEGMAHSAEREAIGAKGFAILAARERANPKSGSRSSRSAWGSTPDSLATIADRRRRKRRSARPRPSCGHPAQRVMASRPRGAGAAGRCAAGARTSRDRVVPAEPQQALRALDVVQTVCCETAPRLSDDPPALQMLQATLAPAPSRPGGRWDNCRSAQRGSPGPHMKFTKPTSINSTLSLFDGQPLLRAPSAARRAPTRRRRKACESLDGKAADIRQAWG